VRLARTPDGRRLEVSRRVAADPDRVWTVLTDTELWPRWGPSVTAVECSDRFVREGSTGRVQVPVGIWLPFAVRTCADRRWTWDVGGVPATGHRVEVVDGRSDAALATFELPPLAAGYAPVCRRALRRIGELAEGKRS
jgi:hypothetical protein